MSNPRHALGLGDYSDSEASEEEERNAIGGGLVAGFESDEDHHRAHDSDTRDEQGDVAMEAIPGNEDGPTEQAGGGSRTETSEKPTPEIASTSGCDTDDAVWGSLPPELRQAPAGQPPHEIISKCHKIMGMTRSGRFFNDALRKNKDIRNPDLLSWLVEHHSINQFGSAFDKDIFDPEGLPEEDKIGSLAAQLEKEQERKKQLRESMMSRPDTMEQKLRAGGGVEFQRGQGAQGALQPSAATVGGSTASLPGQAAINAMKANAVALAAAAAAAAAASGGANKKSKWDSAK